MASLSLSLLLSLQSAPVFLPSLEPPSLSPSRLPSPPPSQLQAPLTEKATAVLFDFNATYPPSCTHAVIRLLYNSTTYDSPSEICCHKRKNDKACKDRVSLPYLPFVLSLPNSRAFELDGCHMKVLEAYNIAHTKC